MTPERRATARGLSALQETLGHTFARPELLEQAVTHSSVGGGAGRREPHYERLEFLGDRVLGLVLAQVLFERFADEREGELARRHADLVRREALVRVARDIGLGDHIRLSRGEEGAGGRDNPAILADCCEAVIAALYLDGGLAAAARFIRARWEPMLAETARPPVDPKTALQEWAQGRGLPLPAYRTVSVEGPDHSPVFSVEASVEGLAPVVAKGPSKQSAEKAAAAELLKRIAGAGDG